MNASLEKTTVKDIAYLLNTSCLRADAGASLEKLADMLCVSDRYKVYLETADGQLAGVVQAKQIAMKILELSREKEEEQDMLPAIVFLLNSFSGKDLAEMPVTIQSGTTLRQVLELMEQNHIREIAVVDADRHLVGTLEAKGILAYYLHAKAESGLDGGE